MFLDQFVESTSLASLTCFSTDFYLFFFYLAAILEIALDSEDAIFQLANIGT